MCSTARRSSPPPGSSGSHTHRPQPPGSPEPGPPPAPSPLDWLVVGGGIHGTHLSLALREAGVPAHRIRILDPGPRLLNRWFDWTSRTGMEHLRSPGVHHIGLAPFALLRFADRRGRRRREMKGRTRRPSVELFRDHSLQVIREADLDALLLRGSLEAIGPHPRGGLQVETDRGVLHTRRLLLAPGQPPPSGGPKWVPGLREAGLPVVPLFGPDFPLGDLARSACRTGRPIVVVGGGISAVQLALRLVRDEVPVALVSRHPLRIHRLDSDPGWMGPRNLAAFRAQPDPARRRQIIVEARHRGSVPDPLARALRAAAVRTDLELLLARRILGSARHGDPPGEPALLLDGGEILPASSVVLATGVGEGVPGASWIRDTSHRLGLPLAGCGFPRVDGGLHWGEGIQCSGGLAELELGPAARNIVGARMAAARVLETDPTGTGPA
ncbi:MAG: hypothetical protein EA352_05105 [Gemmatimonadales bacterium]|nr:MAG: hypothetical protein EA352_05105 [Gemmatimonadales bacterium]